MGEAARVPWSCSLGRPLRSVHGGLALPRRASSPPLWDPAHRWRARKVDPSSEDMVVAGKGGGGSQDSPVPESRRTQEPLSQSGPWFPELSNRQVAFGDAHGPCQPKHASTHRHARNGATGLSLHPPLDGGPPAETLRQHRHSSDSAWPGSALLDPPLQHYPVGTWRRRGPLGPRLGSSARAFLVHEQGCCLLTWGPRPAWLPGLYAPPRLCLGPRVV